jgi:hypothetical protein
MMRVMTAIVIDLPSARRRRSASATPRIAQPAALVDLATYRRARSARRRPRRDEPEHDDEEEDGWTARAHRVIDAAEELLAAGRAAEVVEFCTLAAGCLGRNAAELCNPGAVLGLTQRLGDLRTRACGDG